MAVTRCWCSVLHDQFAVAGRAGDEGDEARDEEAKTGGQVVEHDLRLAGIDERMHHVAADIAGPAGDQNRHDLAPNGARAMVMAVRFNESLCCGPAAWPV